MMTRPEWVAELGSSASSAEVRNLPAELVFPCRINGLAKFRKFRKPTLRNLVAELQNLARFQPLRVVGEVPHKTTPLRGVCVRASLARAHHTLGTVGRARGPPPGLPHR